MSKIKMIVSGGGNKSPLNQKRIEHGKHRLGNSLLTWPLEKIRPFSRDVLRNQLRGMSISVFFDKKEVKLGHF